jgi:hypothetical protein
MSLTAAVASQSRTRVVVGVTGDVQPEIGEAAKPGLFLPVSSHELQPEQNAAVMAVRMRHGQAPDPKWFATRLASALPNPNVQVRSVASGLAASLQQPRFLAVLFGALSSITLLLLTVGVYALADFEVLRRRREMAIRLALGCTPARLRLRLLVVTGWPVAAGALVGLLMSRVLLRWIPDLLPVYGTMGPFDFAWTITAISGVAVLAVWRASREVLALPCFDVLKAS